MADERKFDDAGWELDPETGGPLADSRHNVERWFEDAGWDVRWDDFSRRILCRRRDRAQPEDLTDGLLLGTQWRMHEEDPDGAWRPQIRNRREHGAWWEHIVAFAESNRYHAVGEYLERCQRPTDRNEALAILREAALRGFGIRPTDGVGIEALSRTWVRSAWRVIGRGEPDTLDTRRERIVTQVPVLEIPHDRARRTMLAVQALVPPEGVGWYGDARLSSPVAPGQQMLGRWIVGIPSAHWRLEHYGETRKFVETPTDRVTWRGITTPGCWETVDRECEYIGWCTSPHHGVFSGWPAPMLVHVDPDRPPDADWIEAEGGANRDALWGAAAWLAGESISRTGARNPGSAAG